MDLVTMHRKMKAKAKPENLVVGTKSGDKFIAKAKEIHRSRLPTKNPVIGHTHVVR
jgi:hypothetical protein